MQRHGEDGGGAMDNELRISGFLKRLLDLIPAVIVVLDRDLCIIFRNTEAGGLLHSEDPLRKKLGDVLDCVNASKALGGCGGAKLCRSCSIRNWVAKAIAGKVTRRERVLYKRRHGGAVPMLVTVAPFGYGERSFSLVVIEDTGELEELRALLPICAGCKKIRDDKNYWQSVESYMEAHMGDVRFTHGICPACVKKIYGSEFAKNVK